MLSQRMQSQPTLILMKPLRKCSIIHYAAGLLANKTIKIITKALFFIAKIQLQIRRHFILECLTSLAE